MMLRFARRDRGHEMAFLKAHWKVLALGALLVVVFVLGLVLGHNLSAVSAGSGVVGLIAGWLHKSPNIKALDAAVASATRVADGAARQLATDQRATKAGDQHMDQLLENAGTSVAGAATNVASGGKSLLDESEELGKQGS